MDDMGCQDAVNDTQHFAHQVGITGEQETQLKRKTQYPLTNGLTREHIVPQQSGALGNCSCIALPPASMQSSAIRRAPQLGQKGAALVT
jgi:hypothetical protein